MLQQFYPGGSLSLKSICRSLVVVYNRCTPEKEVVFLSGATSRFLLAMSNLESCIDLHAIMVTPDGQSADTPLLGLLYLLEG